MAVKLVNVEATIWSEPRGRTSRRGTRNTSAEGAVDQASRKVFQAMPECSSYLLPELGHQQAREHEMLHAVYV